MSDRHKRIELLANIAIIVVALLICGVLAKRYLLPSRPAIPSPEAVRAQPGTKLSVPGLDWGRSDRTLLLVLSTGCSFCTESAPFYRRLAEQRAGRQDVRLVAVLPQGVEEARRYLGGLNVAADEVLQSATGAAYTRATPHLILVDRNGSVVESWVGRLPPEQEAEVVRRFLG